LVPIGPVVSEKKLAKNRTYGKIAGFWVITQKPLIIIEI
jgi:hypothetical protein